MSRDLVETIRRHRELGAPSTLEALADAIANRGETDDDGHGAAERCGFAARAAQCRDGTVDPTSRGVRAPRLTRTIATA